MDPSTPPVQVDIYCYDCGTKLNLDEVSEFRPSHDIYDSERENCRRLDDENSIFVPLCDTCYLEELEEENDHNSESSYECYCQGCGGEIDWDITKEEFEQENELHLCSRCEEAED